MFSGFEANAVESVPNLEKLQEGNPTNGNRDLGQPATMPGSAWFYMVTQELLNIVKEASLNPAKTDVTQVKQAILKLITAQIGAIDYSNFVDKTSEQAITGTKTFTLAKAKADQATSLNDLTYATAKWCRAVFGETTAANTWTETQTFSKPIAGAKATASNHLVTKEQLDTAIKNGATVPTGTIIAYAGKTTPSGYLIANGAAVSRTTYANLFTAIGTIYGAGDGKTTFNLPDPRNRHLYGANTASEVGKKLEAGLPNITGEFPTPAGRTVEQMQQFYVGSFWLKENNKGAICTNSGEAESICGYDASKSSALYKSVSTVTVASLKMLWLIKV